MRAGIRHGIGGAQWEAQLSTEIGKWIRTGTLASQGLDQVNSIYATYGHDGGFLRLQPRLSLLDLDGATYLPYTNASRAKKLKAISSRTGTSWRKFWLTELLVDESNFDTDIPPKFSNEELADPWVRIRGKLSSAFTLDFYSWTPKRRFASRDVPDIRSS